MQNFISHLHKSIVLVLIVIGLFLTLNAQEKEEEITYDKFDNFSFSVFYGLNYLDSGVGMGIVSPYFFDKWVAIYLDAGVYIINSRLVSSDNNDESILYQIYGNFKLGASIAYTSERFRAYTKLGLTTIIIRDKSGEDYYRVILTLDPVNKKTDAMFGMHGLMGLEINLAPRFDSQSIFLEAGFDILLNKGETYSSINQSVKIIPINFNLAIGARVYF